MAVQVFKAFYYSLVKLVFVSEEVHLDFKHTKSLENVMFYHKLNYFTIYIWIQLKRLVDWLVDW